MEVTFLKVTKEGEVEKSVAGRTKQSHRMQAEEPMKFQYDDRENELIPIQLSVSARAPEGHSGEDVTDFR
jgi:hypothetical protein